MAAKHIYQVYKEEGFNVIRSEFFTVELGQHNNVDDYYIIKNDKGDIIDTNTPNETMVRRWLSDGLRNFTSEEIDTIIANAKVHGRLRNGQ